MDWLTFITDLLKALAWPLVAVIAIYRFQEPLGELLRDLRRAKYKGLELEFGKKLKELHDKIEKTPIVSPSQRQQAESQPQPLTDNVRDQSVEYVPRPTESYRDEIEDVVDSLVNISPRAAVAEAWRHLELQMLDAANFTGKRFPRPTRALGQFLLREGILPKVALPLFDELRVLRNQAVHAGDFGLSPDQARDYCHLAEKLEATLRIPRSGKGKDGK